MRFWLFILTMQTLLWAQPYYVSTSGNDSDPGTLAQPWLTVQKAANTLTPGDTVYVRGGAYNEAVTINVSGTEAGGYIVFKNYPGENPILDGTGLTVPGADNGMFLISNRNYIVIDGFEIQNYSTSVDNRVPVGIFVIGTSHHIRILNCDIHDIAHTGTPALSNAHGIAFYGTAAPDSIHDVVIDNCNVYNLTLGFSEAVVLNGNVSGFTISNDSVYNCNNIGIDIIGGEGTSPDNNYDTARNGSIRDNVAFSNSTFANPSYSSDYSAAGIYVDGGKDVIIERNTVFLCDFGIEAASEHAGRYAENITIRNNVVARNTIAGITIGGYNSSVGGTKDCEIRNNTFFENDVQQDFSGELYIQYDTQDNTIINNVFYANSQNLLIENFYTENSGNVVDYNVFYGPAGAAGSQWEWKQVYYGSFAAYQAGTGNDANSIFIDPLFNSTALPFDFTLQASSPAIDAGNPAIAYDDTCSAYAQGTSRNDAGRYGGPDACEPIIPEVTVATISIPTNLTGAPGDTVSVPVTLNRNGDDISSLGAAVKATNGILTYVDFTEGPIIPGASFNVNGITDDSVRIAFVNFGGGNITQDGILVTMRFVIDSMATAGNTSAFDFSVLSATDGAFANIPLVGSSGLLAVEAPPLITANIKFFLQGPYDASGDTMTSYLSAFGLLPLSQPYNTFPWHYGGSESVTSIPGNMVDWVLLELRNASGDSVTSRAAFLRSDGMVVDMDGTSAVSFDGLDDGSYSVVIWQRNHLAVISAATLSLSSGSALYDFSTGQGQAFGLSPMTEVESGVFGLRSGDGNNDNGVDALDKNIIWRNQNGGMWSYTTLGDFNLDGGIDALDLNLGWRVNNGSASQVP